MDVDGYEIDVIEGATEALSRYKPVMMMEFAPYFFSRGEVIQRVVGCPYGPGLRCTHRKRKGSVPGAVP